MKMVIYHRSDFDGIFCREIAKHFLGAKATYIGWEYGDPEPDVSPDDELMILDLSVPGLMSHPKLTWIDHHKSAMEKYPDSIPGYRIDGVAACRLAWFWFTAWDKFKNQTSLNPDESWFQAHYPFAKKDDFVDRKIVEPLAVRLAGEYDIWDKRDPNAELFQHGLRSRDLSQNMWDLLLVPIERNENGHTDVGTVAVEALLEDGKILQHAKTEENESIIKSCGFTVKWEGLTFLACNAARYNSFLFTAGLKPEHDALLGFNYDGKKWKVSLYHAPGKERHDLSLIAVNMGGGGHRGACGFTCQSLPFPLCCL